MQVFLQPESSEQAASYWRDVGQGILQRGSFDAPLQSLDDDWGPSGPITVRDRPLNRGRLTPIQRPESL